jgi:branched-chain amino acid transport system substrate-binding protein
LNKAIAAAPFKSVRGDFRFGKNNYPIQNYHIFEIGKAGNGKPEFKLVAADILKSHSDPYAAQCTAR